MAPVAVSVEPQLPDHPHHHVLLGKVGATAALVITSFMFGLLHLCNPHSSLFGAVGIAELTQTAIFGLNVSGVPIEPGLLVARLQGPEWLSGGEVGIEGSIVTIAVGLVVNLVMLRAATAKKPPVSSS